MVELWSTPLLLAGLAGWAVALHLHTELGRRAALTARACHEVRGPLTAAGLALHAAARRGGASVLPAVETELRRAALAIEDLVDDLERRRRVPDHPRPVELRALLEAQLPAWRAVAGAVDVRLRGDVSGAAWVDGEPIRLAQALGNLVANAAEHGAGPVELRVRHAAGERVAVEVADDGPGLPAPVDLLAAREGRGRRGHGLAVAADVARRHGGRLFAAPSARGARLVLELPAADAPAAAEPAS